MLQRYFLKTFAAQYKKPLAGLTRRAQTLLARYSWPGNVRELENVIGHACMMTESDVIDVRDLPEPYPESAATEDAESEVEMSLTGSHACMLTAFWLTSAGTRCALPKSWGSAAHISMNCSRKHTGSRPTGIQTQSKMSQNCSAKRPKGWMISISTAWCQATGWLTDTWLGSTCLSRGCPNRGFAVRKKHSWSALRSSFQPPVNPTALSTIL